ncbi:hypothetical protein G9A89_021461 [Geosiphon pyriformis]|nr:hypothetical protein G9A89_021461 [Geosiphon pyriformis]
MTVSLLTFFSLMGLWVENFSQAALDACKVESLLVCPDFRNWCWIEHHHVLNVICHKNLVVNWVKVKGHSGVLGNKHADKLAKDTVFLDWFLPYLVGKHFLKTDAAGFTSVQTAGFWMYFIKVLYYWLLVAVCKQLYDKCYLSVLLATCAADIEVSSALCKGFVLNN